MTTQITSKQVIAVAVIASTMLGLSTVNDAFAHLSFSFVPGSGSFEGSNASPVESGASATAPSNGPHTVKIVVGETYEPAYVGDIHDLEVKITHPQTSFGVNSANRDQTKVAYDQGDFSATGKVLKVDTFFYPASKLYSYTTNGPQLYGGVKYSNVATTNPGANTAGFWCDNTGTVTSSVLTGNAYNCVANSGGTYGYVDSRSSMFLRPLAAHEVPAGFVLDGAYRQSTRQHYTDQGLTLYHVYGSLNYFNDTSIGLTNINFWTDGKNIKTISLSQGANYTNNVLAIHAGGTVANRTTEISSGFGLSNLTSSAVTGGYSQGIAWPDDTYSAINANTYPTDIRPAIGQTRDTVFDIWNVLEEITDALRTVTGFGSVQDHTPRNSTNSKIPSPYEYP